MNATTPFDHALPRPVPLLPDRPDCEVLIQTFTLGDVAGLQAWLSGLTPCPADAPPGASRADLVARWHALADWPPPVLGPAGRVLLATPTGRLVQLVTSMARADTATNRPAGPPGAVARRAMEVQPDLDADPTLWARFDRIVWGVSNWRVLFARLAGDDDELAGPGSGDELDDLIDDRPPFDPGLALAGLVQDRGWTWEQAAGLYLTQFALMCRRLPPGRDGEPGRPGAPDEFRGLARRPGEPRRDWLRRSGGFPDGGEGGG